MASTDDQPVVIVLSPTGTLDAYTVGGFRSALAKLPVGPARVVINLTTVTFLDSAGLGAIVGAVRRIRETGGKVAVAASGAPARVLRTAGLDRIVTVVGHPDEANAAMEDVASE